MVDPKSYLEMAEDISRMERAMSNLFHYGRARGGGILWEISYWLLYAFSLYGIISYIGKIDKFNTLKSIGFTIFITIGFLLFFAIGCFLVYGVHWQMRTLNRWHRQQFNDYKEMIEKNVHNVFTMIGSKDKVGYYTGEKCMQDLGDSMRSFEKRYFPKKED